MISLILLIIGGVILAGLLELLIGAILVGLLELLICIFCSKGKYKSFTECRAHLAKELKKESDYEKINI